MRPQDDAFGHRVIARRIARRLQEEPIPTQVVVGALGSGKTTLRCLVQHELGTKTRTRVLSVELWPYDTPQAAMEGVLRTLLQGVGREVNVLAARGLPEQYVAAMSAAGGMASKLATLQARARSPFDVLESIDRIATTIDHRFVVWVEDLERFAGNTTGGESLEHSQRLAPLRALLFGLSELRSVSVVTATTDLHARFDVEKIARYVEALPLLDPMDTERILRTFRHACLDKEKNKFIHPGAPDWRGPWVGFDSPDNREIREAFGCNISPLARAVMSLFRTPRSLKQVLRISFESWNALLGEIDFDDLLVMQLLRVCEPEVFAAIARYCGQLARIGLSEAPGRNAMQVLAPELETLSFPEDRREAVEAVIRSVFEVPDPETKPQSLREQRYWTRFLSVPEIAETDRDQSVLQAFHANKIETLLDLLETPRSHLVERFAHLLQGERIVGLLVPLVKRRAGQCVADWRQPGQLGGNDPPGLIPLWRMLVNRAGAHMPTVDIIRTEVLRAVEEGFENLYLVSELECCFAVDKPGAGDLRDACGEFSQQMRAQLRQLLTQRYCDSPSALSCALRGSPWVTLFRVVRGWSMDATQQVPVDDFTDWAQLATTILAACRKDREVMLPQLAPFITRLVKETSDAHGQIRGVYEFDEGRAIDLFGSEADVLGLFVDPVEVEPEARGMVDAVQEAALAWLGQQQKHQDEDG